MITSSRKFGVEIEFYCADKKMFQDLRKKVKNLTEDGSIRHVNYSAEWVSPILEGKTGEQTIRETCETLKKFGASGDNPAMSIHVHLDAKKNDREVHQSVEKPQGYKRALRLSNKLSRMLDSNTVWAILSNDFASIDTVQYSEFGGIRHMSLARLTSEPKDNFIYFYTKETDRFKWLRNMFYFYAQYSKVMEDIVSNSRKFGNMYCIPIGESYELSDIESCNTVDDLYNLWYKGRGSNGHYDDSRYHNVNLHSYWDRHGTVEIRSHGGTVDPNKILLWVKLHQTIADKLETMSLKDIKPKTPNLHKEFVDFIEDPLLQSYVKRLMGFYSGIKIK